MVDKKPNLIGPYLEWAVATDFAYLPGDWFPVLLQLAKSASDFALRTSEKEFEDVIQVPAIYQTVAADITFCMGIMSRKALAQLVEERPRISRRVLRTLYNFLEHIELGSPLVRPFKSAKPPHRLKPSTATRLPRTAVVAVIDDGLAFAHERFRFANGKTRFKYFWNQDDVTGIGLPNDLSWGRELAETEINNLLRSCSPSGFVNEDEFYRQAGQTLVKRRAKHGTHVMDLACGRDPQDSSLSPYLIGVQLPRWVTMETSGGLLTPMVYAALTFIVNRADQIAAQDGTAPLPIVVNLSYGMIAGPHDGTAPLEAAIDQLIAARKTAPLRVVLPAGNHFLARCRARFALPRARSPVRKRSIKRLHWRVQPDSKSAAFMEIWLPETPGAKIAVRITTPTGVPSPWIEPGPHVIWSWPDDNNYINNDVRFRAQYFVPTRGRPWILLAMAPTAALGPNLRTAPSGTWLVEVINRGRAITVDAWVQRGDTPPGYPLYGRQSRFDDSRYVRFDPAGRPEENDAGNSYILRRGTINALATGQRSIVMGGFRRSDCAPSRYSGAGPISSPRGVPPWRVGPDAAAVGDDSVALHGVLAAGTRTGSVIAMDGTSVAAPQITRLISEWMIQGLASDRAALQAFAALYDKCPPLKPSIPAPEQRIGAGRIERPPLVPARWTRW